MSEKQFLQYLREHNALIFKLINLYADSNAEKQDYYQEIVYQCWKGWPQFRGQAKFSTWLYRVSLNTLLTLKRKTDPTAYMDDLEPLAPVADAEDDWQEQTHLLYQTIKSLNPIDKALISMHLDGYNNPEIGDTLGITANHVGVKLHRIKQDLKNKLNP